MKRKLVIFINGPAGSGKDLCAELASHHLGNIGLKYKVVKFAAPLRKAVRGLLGIADDDIEDLKSVDIAAPGMPVYTVRDLMISLAEKVVKSNISRRHFGVMAAEEINRSWEDVFFVTDAGFSYEVEAALDCLLRPGSYHCVLWRIDRPGKTFIGDSRWWVTINPVYQVPVYELHNTGTIMDLDNQIEALMPKLLKECEE